MPGIPSYGVADFNTDLYLVGDEAGTTKRGKLSKTEIAKHALAGGVWQSLRRRPTTARNVSDSIGAGDAVGYPTGPVWQASASTYVDHALRRAGYKLLSNKGVGGQNSTTILARFDDDAFVDDQGNPFVPGVVLIQCGTNDVYNGMTDGDIATLMDNMEAMVLKCLLKGAIPVIATPPPKDTSGTLVPTRRVRMHYYDLAQYYGIPLIDTFMCLVDASSGAYKSGHSNDGVHPNDTGVAAVLAHAVDVLSTLRPCGPYLAAVAESGTGNVCNLIGNGNFANGSIGSLSGWTENFSNTTATLETSGVPTNCNGRTLKCIKTGGTGLQHFVVSGGPSVTPGDVWTMSGRFKQTGMTPATSTGLSIQAIFDVSSGITKAVNRVRHDGDETFSWDFPIPSSQTSLNLYVTPSDDCTYEFNNLTLINKTAMRAIWTPGT